MIETSKYPWGLFGEAFRYVLFGPFPSSNWRLMKNAFPVATLSFIFGQFNNSTKFYLMPLDRVG